MAKLLILPGWQQNKKLWAPMTDKLSQWDAEAIDLPGFGEEPLVRDDWGIPEYADWVTDQINKQETVLLGHSFGGRIAGFIATERPSWLKALILSGAPCLYRPSNETRVKRKFAQAARRLGIRGRSLRSTDYQEAVRKGMGNIFQKVVGFDMSETLRKINVPTLLIWGSQDSEVPLYIANEMNKLIPNSRLELIENSGHNSFIDNPNLYYGITKHFVENL